MHWTEFGAKSELPFEEKCTLELYGIKITLPDPYGISALEWDGDVVNEL